MRTLPKYEVINHAAEEPILLIGPPERLIGKLRLRNRGDQKVVLRRGRLCNVRNKERGAAPTALPSETIVTLTAILFPGQGATVPIRASVDPHTPPGEYDASLVVGEYTYPVHLEVVEQVDLEVAPTRILIENRPGERIAKRVVFSNHGNVDVTVGAIGAVPLDEQLAVCRTIRATLAEASETAETINQWITAYLRQGKRQLERSGMLWVDAENGPVALPRGESTSVNLVFRVPDTLDSKTRYFAVAYIYDVDIEIVVVPSGAKASRVRRSK